MVAKYYVAVRPQTNDYHAVHKEGCPFLHDDSKKIFLGVFKSGQDAIRESQHSFAMTKNCLFCCKEERVSSEKMVTTLAAEPVSGTVRLQIPVSYKQGMFCCLN
jgi:hypothetical protein